MRDRETGTVWNHIDGKATQGPLVGERLTMIPLPMTTWGIWRDEHPESTVMSFDTPYQQHYRHASVGTFGRDEALYGDNRLPSNTLVLGVEIQENYRAYTLSALEEAGGLLNDELGGESVVAVYDSEAGTAIAYRRLVDSKVIAFNLVDQDGWAILEDPQTGSQWNLQGIGISGPLSGEELKFASSIISEWYGWSAYHPETDLWEPQDVTGTGSDTGQTPLTLEQNVWSQLPSQPECVDDPTVEFTSHVTDLERIDFIQPAAVISGNWFKNRSYLTIARDEEGYPYEVPVYAPVDSRLTGITFYVQPMLDESGDWVNVEQYDLRFEVSCQVDFGFDHIWTLTNDIASFAPSEPATSTRDAEVPASFLVKAGDLIGYTTGTIRAHTWDFIVSNESQWNSFANQERYENTGDLSGLLHGDCPYDYYSHSMRSEYLSLFGGFGGSGGGTDCSFSFDELGTIAGAWFTKEFIGEGPAIYDPGWGVAIGVGADGYITVNGDDISIRVKPDRPTYVDPKAIVSEHCYENTDGSGGRRGAFVYVELLTVTELGVAFGEGRCPQTLPTESRTYYR